jgi:hypothetical protein
MATDLSGATVGELQVQGDVAPRAELVTVPDQQPDITKHSPDIYAGLTGQKALERLHSQGLLPTADDIKGIESEALKAANEFHARLAEQQSQAQLEIQKRQAAVASGTLSAEEKTRAAVDIAKQQAQEQWKQGPSAAAVAAAQPGGLGAGEIKQLPDTDRKDFAGYFGAFNTIQNLHDLFHQMVQKTPGAGNVVTSLAGLTTPIANLTSDEARTYHAYAESSLVPLAKGVMGDAATAAAKDRIQANLLSGLPTMTDSLVSGGHKIYTLLDRNMTEMQNQRDLLRGNGYDTTSLDSKILDAQQYMKSPQVQMYNPFKRDAIVQSGTSDQANAAIANVTTGANAGLQVQNQAVQQPQGQAGAYTTPPGYTPPQPPQPSYGRQSAQAVGAAAGGALQTAGSVIGGGLTSTGELSSGLGTTLNWLGGLLPENWPQQAFQQPRPWETTSNQFVGTGQ